MSFKRQLIALLCLLPSITHAQAKLASAFSLSGNATYVESTAQQARTFGITPSLAIKYPFHETISFYAKASAILETGSHKGTLLDDFKPDQQVVLNYAYFEVSPWQTSQLRLGAIPMKDYANDLHINSSRFLGFSANQEFNFGDQNKLDFFLLAAIPSNQELTNRLGNVSEGTPRYWQAGAQLSLPGDLLGIKLKSYVWEYTNVTGNVAYQSGFMGNQTIGVGSTNTKLAYAFKGITSSVDFNGELSSMRWNFGGDYIFNDGAPNNRNLAKRARFTLGSGDHDFEFSWYEIQSDATIGYYNSALLGHTNRDGLALEYRYQYSKDIKMGMTIVHAQTLRTTLLQADQDAVSLWWEFTNL